MYFKFVERTQCCGQRNRTQICASQISPSVKGSGTMLASRTFKGPVALLCTFIYCTPCSHFQLGVRSQLIQATKKTAVLERLSGVTRISLRAQIFHQRSPSSSKSRNCVLMPNFWCDFSASLLVKKCTRHHGFAKLERKGTSDERSGHTERFF